MRSFIDFRTEIDRLDSRLDAGAAVTVAELTALEAESLHYARLSKGNLPIPRLVRLMTRAGAMGEALTLLEKTLSLGNASGDIALLLANMRVEQDDFDGALAAILPFLRTQDGNAMMLRRAADFNARLGRTNECLRLYREAAARDKSWTKTFINALLVAGRAEDALAEARTMLSEDTSDIALGFACFCAIIRFSKDNAEKTRATDWLLAKIPGDATGALWRARIQRWKQNLEQSFAEFNLAIEQFPTDQTILRERAQMAYLLGNWGRDAKALLDGWSVTSSTPEHAEVMERVEGLLAAYGGSVREAAAQPDRFAHVRTPESVFDLVAGSKSSAPLGSHGTGLAMIAHSLTAGGAERIIANSFKQLRAGGQFDWVKLYLFNLSPENGSDFYLPLTGLASEDVTLINRDCKTSPPFSFLPLDIAKTCQALYNRLIEDKPAIVHVSLEPLTMYAGLAALHAGVPRIVLHTHNMRPTNLHPDSPMPPRWRDWYRALLSRPEICLVGCAEASIRDYADWIGLDNTTNLHVVYNGLNFDLFRPAAGSATAAKLRAQLGIDRGAPVIGTAFKFRDEKRPLLLVETACRVLEQHPNARFVMFGDGPLLEATRESIAAHGATEKILLPGLVDDLHNRLPMLDLFVLSSKTEALPNVLIEAQAAGVPVVARHVGGIAETMIAGETGLLVEEDSPEALADAILTAINDKAWCKRAAKLGRDFVRTRFDTEKMIEKLSAIMLRKELPDLKLRGAERMAVRFMLLMPWGRVGSNMLYSILRQSKGIKLVNENLIALPTAQDQRIWFEEFYETAAAEPSKPFIGSKQNARSIADLAEMQHLLRANEVRVIRMQRENIVKAAISQMRAVEYAEVTQREYGQARWALRIDAKPLGSTAINPAVLLERIAEMEDAQQKLAAISGALDIEYEEINSDLDGVVRRLRDFLSLPHTPYDVGFKKLTPDDLSSAISNYAEIKDILSGTRYAVML